MHKIMTGLCLACAAARPAFASEDTPAERAKGIDWSLSASGGLTKVDDSGDQPFVRFGVTRFIGDGYVRASVTRFSTRQGAGITGAVPAKTVQVSLAGGHSFGRVSLDGYASLGWRKFDQESYRRETGGMIEIVANGRTAAGGVSLAYELPLGKQTVLTPFIAGDINRADIARAITVVGRGSLSQKESQTGETGSAGFTLDKTLGAGGHRIGAYGAVVTTSNSALAVRSSAPNAAASLFGPQDVPGVKDSWGEYGASATLRLSKAVLLDLSVVRTAGFRGGESTSFATGLRLRF